MIYFCSFSTAYPHIHSSKFIKREVVNTYSLLYTVQGSDPSLKPYLLMGHMDVVPVDDQIWEVPPFEGRIKDGYLYGRGTIDNKNTIVVSDSMCPSMVFLLFTPQLH